ncbi:MAG TPA: GerMN domain-containing protein, partial [Lachnospiraceae bacterium]|nr:GerMN domain-containing protein [Lachnospiraceae bacterium]
MKKRCRWLQGILAILIVLCFTGCQNTAAETDNVFYMYYVNKSDTKVVREAYTPENTETEKLIAECLSVLSSQPENVELKSPVNDNVSITGWTLQEGQLRIDFDKNYYQIDSIAEVLRRAAIVRTLSQIDGIDGISFTVEEAPITDSKELPIGVMTADSFVDNTGAEINSYERTDLRLYFADESGTKLISSIESIAYSSNISMEKLVTEQIIEGPASAGAHPTVSPTTKILGVTIKDGICYLNLSADFLTISYPVSEEMVVYSFVNSLTELPNVNKVQISIDGESDM